jgi:glutaredoxin
MPKNITVFTSNTCAYCVMVKKYLKMKGATYEEVNIDEHPERQKDAYALSGQLAVPVVVVTNHDDSQQVVVGYNLSQLAPALA